MVFLKFPCQNKQLFWQLSKPSSPQATQGLEIRKSTHIAAKPFSGIKRACLSIRNNSNASDKPAQLDISLPFAKIH
ncbi:hypothetical protein FJ208_01440 [Candidatus Gribaldobacteria bacterium]|nr:hypothetical protein [Candidatus Gribaldobacteria bacterium]